MIDLTALCDAGFFLADGDLIPGKTTATSVRCARTPAPRKTMARKRRGRQGFNHGTNVDITESRVSTTTTKTIDVSKMNPARVAKQLEQIKATVRTTVVGILFAKQYTRLCNDDGMSKKDALTCIEGDLIKVGKHAPPALDFSSHDQKTPASLENRLRGTRPKKLPERTAPRASDGVEQRLLW